MYLDLSCPLEMLGYELLRDDNSNLRVYLLVGNLSRSRVSLIEGEVRWISRARGVSVDVPFTADDMRAGPRAQFKLQMSTSQPHDADHVELVFHRIGFEDASSDWQHDPSRLVQVDPPNVPKGRQLNMLLAVAGRDALNFPHQSSTHWMCVCGRANPPEQMACARCERDRDDVLHSLSQSAILIDGASNVPVVPIAEPEIPEFLTPPASEPKPVSEAEQTNQAYDALRSQLRGQRNVLLRRSIFLLSVVVIVLLLMYAFEWLTEKQQQALEIRPPVKIEQSEDPEP